MKLTKKAIKQIKDSPEIITGLIHASNRSYPTIMRWLDENHEMLTTAACLTVICDHLKVSQDTILQKEVKS